MTSTAARQVVRAILLLSGAAALGPVWVSGCVLRPLPALPCPCAEGHYCADGLCVPGAEPSIDASMDGSTVEGDAGDATVSPDAAPSMDDAATADAGSDAGACARVSFGGKIYLHCAEPVTWYAADARCAGLGMRLLRIETLDENELGRGLATTRIWLGGTDRDVEGDWHWQDGTPFWTGGLTGMPVGGAFTLWDVGEPNDLGGEDCLAMRRDGQWLDEQCDLADNNFICEPM